jgi:hypothetical protein
VRLQIDPYLARVYDPLTYDCWAMFREAWLELTGVDVGPRPGTLAATMAVWRHFRPLAVPISPAAVLMRQRGSVAHVGLFWRRRVLHIGPAGGRYDRLHDATLGFDQVGFYGCNTSS